jgi:hypothetical protein
MQVRHLTISIALFFAGTSLAFAQATPSMPEMPMPEKLPMPAAPPTPEMPAAPEPPATAEPATPAMPAPEPPAAAVQTAAPPSVYPPCSATLQDQCTNSTHKASQMHHRKARKRG